MVGGMMNTEAKETFNKVQNNVNEASNVINNINN